MRGRSWHHPERISFRFILGVLLAAIACGPAYGQWWLTYADLTVICLDKNGNPVEGTEVRCAPSASGGISTKIVDFTKVQTSDIAGKCIFPQAPANTWHYIFARKGNLTAWAEYREFDQPLRITLDQGFGTEGVVRNASNEPVKHAAILADNSLLLTVTDEEGRYEIPRVSKYTERVGILKEGYAFTVVDHSDTKKHAPTMLVPSATIEGTIRWPHGRPVPNAYIFAFPFETETDQFGYYRIDFMEPSFDFSKWEGGKQMVQASANFAGVRFWGETSLKIRCGFNRVDLTISPIRARKFSTLSGRIAFAESNAPVHGAVAIGDNEDSLWFGSKVPFGDDGKFVIKGLSWFKCLCAIPADPLLTWSNTVKFDFNRPRDVEGVVLEVKQGSAIRGVVYGPDDKPLENACVQLSERHWSHMADTDSSGRFELHNLDSEEQSYDVGVRTGDHYYRTTVGPTRRGQFIDVEIHLPHMVRISGQILSPEGIAAGSVVVQLAGQSTITSERGEFLLNFPWSETGTYSFTVKERPGGSVVDPATARVVKGGTVKLAPDRVITDHQILIKWDADIQP